MAISRRGFIELGLAGGLVLASGGRARAIGPGSKFRFGQLKLNGGEFNPRPTALRRMAWEIEKRTSIDVDLKPKVINLEHDALHRTPFLYLAGDREFDVPSERAIEKLRRFLTFGGFLLIDSAEGTVDGAFDRSVRRFMEALYPPPAKSLEIVPGAHVAFKSFYLIDRPFGRVAMSSVMQGVLRDGRLPVVYVQNDLGGAWARDNFGNYEYPCVPGGARQREMAYRLGTNLVMYSMCLDYKSDQVHVEFIMRRRRWRPNDGADAIGSRPSDDTVRLAPRRPPKKKSGNRHRNKNRNE